MRTAADKLREDGLREGLERGREEGRQEGRQEGLERGRAEGRARLARSLVSVLQRRFGPLDPAAVAQVTASDFETLERQLTRIFDAETLDEILAPLD